MLSVLGYEKLFKHVLVMKNVHIYQSYAAECSALYYTKTTQGNTWESGKKKKIILFQQDQEKGQNIKDIFW